MLKAYVSLDYDPVEYPASWKLAGSVRPIWDIARGPATLVTYNYLPRPMYIYLGAKGYMEDGIEYECQKDALSDQGSLKAAPVLLLNMLTGHLP